MQTLSPYPFCLVLLCTALGLNALGNDQPTHQVLPNFDKRQRTKVPADRVAGAAHLKGRVADAAVNFDEVTGAPQYVTSRNGFLSERQKGPGAAKQDPQGDVKSFVREHPALFGHGPEALDRARLKRDFTARHNGLRTIVWEQALDEIPVWEGIFIAHMTRDGDLASVSSKFVPDPEAAANRGMPNWRAKKDKLPISKEMAIAIAARNLGGEARNPYAKLVWLPTSPTAMRLAWEVYVRVQAGGDMYRLLVDAETGEVLLRHLRTFYLSPATYNVFTNASPAPMAPGLATPSTNQAPYVPRTRVTIAAWSTNASPVGWIGDGDSETRGNNIDARLDRNADDLPDSRPQGGPDRVFDYPLDLTQSPATYGEASVVNMFYWLNWMHDRLYEYGFDEAAGNYQKDNFGRGGEGNDPVIVDAQDGSGVNNAHFIPAPDGTSGHIELFLFDGPDPDRDAALDAEVMLHEYTHGMTDRMVGGGVGIYQPVTAGLAEGWSDFYALSLLNDGSNLDGNYTEGGYLTYQFFGLVQNYYFGIRRYPYTTDMSKNPLTFKDLDPKQITSYPNVPRSPISPFNPAFAEEPHRMGELWCVTLWELRANLIRKYGFPSGNDTTLQIVTDALKLSPPNPTYLQERDAILLADRLLTTGANQSEIWSAFAKRGMGLSATDGPNWTTEGIREAFDRPDTLTIVPVNGLRFSGGSGGPIEPACRILAITNPSAGSVSWSLSSAEPGFTLSSSSGTLGAGQGVAVQVCPTSVAAGLAVGNHATPVFVTNLTSGVVQRRDLVVQVLEIARMPFTEDFESDELSGFWTVSGVGPARTLLSTNDGPHGGRQHLTFASGTLGHYSRNEATVALDLAGYTNVVLRLWAKEFNANPDRPPTAPFYESADFDGVAISVDGYAWYEAAGLRRLRGDYSEVVVPLDSVVAKYGLAYTGQFRIRFNQAGTAPIPEDGIAIDDISITGVAPRRFALSLPVRIREDAGTVHNQAAVQLPIAAPQGVVVQLTSSNPQLITVPPTVVLLAGTTSAAFDLSVVDDELLNGERAATIVASAAEYYPGEGTVRITDNENATVSISVDTQLQEGRGLVAGAGRIRLDRPPVQNMLVELYSSDPPTLSVPPGVMIAGGQTSAVFNVFLGDNGALDGPKIVTVTARVPEQTEATVNVTVLDDEGNNLLVTLPPLLNEASTTLTSVGSVRIAGTVPTNVVVFLSSSHTNKLRVPATLTIPTGRTSISFNLTLLDDFVAGSAQVVTVSATAAGFAAGQSATRILDNDSAPLAYNPRPQPAATTSARDVQLAWDLGVPELIVNGGFESGDFSGWVKQTTGGGDFVINSGIVDPPGPEGRSQPYGGRFSILSQQSSPGVRTVYQDLVLPVFFDSAVLNWTHRIHNYAGQFSADHFFRVEIRAPDNTLLAVAFSTQPGDVAMGDWEEHTFGLQNYRGNAVRIAFIESDSLGFLNVGLDNVRVFLSSPGVTSSEIYLGTTTNLGPTQLLGATTNTFWQLPPLAMDSRYYWQIVTRRGDTRAVNPIWQFSTRGIGPIDHFVWNPVASNQVMSRPFPASIIAKDADGNTISNFSRSVSLTAQMPETPPPVSVLTFTGFRLTSREYRHTLAAISLYFTNYVETFFTATDPTALEAQLAGKNVLLVLEQDTAPVERMASLGADWGPVLKTFVNKGGIVIACSYTRDEHEILNSGGLMQLTKISPYQTAQLQVSAAHPLAEGVAPSFGGANLSGYTSEDGLGVISVANGTNAVVLTRDYGAGRVVMIGTDYNVNRTDMDRVVANAVKLAQGSTTRTASVSPEFTGYFINGMWSGNVAALAAGSNIVITADDGEGHIGRSVPMAVAGQNDLSVTLMASPDPVTLGSNIVYNAQVRNSGPATATGITLTFNIPAALELLRITNSQGSCTMSSEGISCEIGILGAKATAQVILEAAARTAGAIQVTAVATSSTEDAYPDNNTDTATTRVGYPSIFIFPRGGMEGNSGTTTMTFSMQLHPASSKTVTVQYASSNITATAGVDYEPQSGVVTFAPGQTNQSLTFTIYGDRLFEGLGETFAVYLSNPSNAILGEVMAIGNILEDDPGPALSIADATVVEGADGTTTQAVFAVQLSTNAAVTVTVNYSTIGGSASPVQDFLSTSGTIIFPPGVTTTNVSVIVKGDRISETNETFFVRLSDPVNATIARNQATATILDDDAGEVATFVWNAIPSEQQYGVPFPVTITAMDALGNTAASFAGPVSLNGWAAARQNNVGPGGAPQAFPMGTYFHDERIQAIYPHGEVGEAARITALALLVQIPPGQTLSRWTIRMKHSELSDFNQPVWEQDWTTVYQNNETVISGGWVKFQFTRPFEYNGVQNLLVDFSFNNDTYTTDGQCDTVATTDLRALYFRSDSAFGDPLDWSGAEPPAELARWVPSIQFFAEKHINIAPVSSDSFTNGLWTGNLAVFDVVEDMSLRADDGRKHTGSANLFRVVTTNDLAISAGDAPDPVRAGDALVFTYVVTNSGPATASGVVVSNPIPANTTMFVAQPSQGSCVIGDGLVRCSLGAVSGGGTATITVQGMPQESGFVTNTVFVSSDNAELFLGNNEASSVTRVNPRALLLSDVTVTEMTGAFTNAVFNVRLSSASGYETTVEYFTSDITATNGVDYLETKGLLVFAPGATNLSISVPIIGDVNDEPTESFRLNLANPTNAVVLNSSATATILDDDPPPIATVLDTAAPEGNAGSTFLGFPVRIFPPSGFFANFIVTMSNGTATAGSDYFQQTLTVLIPPGFTNRTINATVFGDRLVEPDETFFLNLSRANNVTLATNLVRGTIINDDGLPGVVETFAWSHVPSPQRVGRPVPVTIEARDSLGNVATNFNGAALIRGRLGQADVLVGNNNSQTFNPLGTSFHDNRTDAIYLVSELGGARRITGLALEVLLPPGQPLNHWTIRMKHTTLSNFVSETGWQTNGWTTVYQNTEIIERTGWVQFIFQTPFDYNGTNNLMVDFSFDNSYFTVDGLCRFTGIDQGRTIYALSDSEGGNPKNWGTFPGPLVLFGMPTVQFISGFPVDVTPDVTAAFAQGVWSGGVNVLEPASDMRLIAEDTAGHSGMTVPFTTEYIADSDGDGLLDSWEMAYFGSLDASPNADPDGDGLTNLQEQTAGTNPRDGSSVLRIIAVEFNSAEVNVHFTSVIGRTYRVEGAQQLGSGQWSVIADNLPGIDGILRVTDFNAPAAGHRFYRVRLLP